MYNGENFKEVDFATYCPKCTSFKVMETDDPCNECLACGARNGTRVPINFKDKKTKK